MTQAGPRTVLLGNVTGPIRKEVLSSGVVKLVECNLELLGAIFDIIQGETAQLWNQFRGKQNRKPKANLLQHWSNPNASNAPMDSLVYKPIDFLLLCKLVGVGFLFSSVQFSHPVTSDSLQSHGLQHASLPCPSPNPRACSNWCPLSRWCHPTILSSVIAFSCLQSFPASGSFPMSWFFAPGGQRIGVSASASVLPMNTQDWFPLRLTGGSP